MANFSKDSIRCFDSASIIYYNAHFYPQSIYWSKKSLRHNDSNAYSLAILARSYQKLSSFQNSIDCFEKLIKIDPKPENYLYLAESQYRLKRLMECIQTTMIAEQTPINYEYSYSYIDTSNRKNTTNIKSALMNFRGLAYFDLGNYDEAEKSFEQALQYDPTFLLSNFNLSIVKQKKRSGQN
ncbi:MAG TPA: tetratricopeptide repeat protein [Bacteroidia bacterium]